MKRGLMQAALAGCTIVGLVAGGTATAEEPAPPPAAAPNEPPPPPPPPSTPAPTAPPPRTPADEERIRQLQKEISELKRKLEGVPEPKRKPSAAERIAELEAERDRLQAFLDTPLWRFHEDRINPRSFALDVGTDFGHNDNLGRTHHDRESDSYFRPELDFYWGDQRRRQGVGLNARQYLYEENDDENYGEVEFRVDLGDLHYRLRDISESSDFVTDRIETTRHTIALGDDGSVRQVADQQGFEPMDAFLSGEFVSGDLDYKAFTLMVGPRWNQMQRIRRGQYDEGLGWQFRALLGFTRRWYDTHDYRDETALIGQVDFAYAAPRWVAELQARSRLEDDIFEKTGHKRVSDAGFKVEQGSGWFRLIYGASAGMEQYDQGDGYSGEDRRDVVVRARAGVGLRLVPHGVISFAYVPEWHESNRDEYDALVSVLELVLRLTF